MADYVTPAQLAAALKLRDSTDPRLQTCCTAASDLIDQRLGRAPGPYSHGEGRLEPVPAIVEACALPLAISFYKQPDATFGIVGIGETGPVRIARDLFRQYQAELTPYMNLAAAGVG